MVFREFLSYMCYSFDVSIFLEKAVLCVVLLFSKLFFYVVNRGNKFNIDLLLARRAEGIDKRVISIVIRYFLILNYYVFFVPINIDCMG